jgi:hypothetical protein
MADDLRIFPDEFVPNIQGAPYHSKWESANKNGDTLRWRAFRDALLVSGTAAIPVMATKYGRALVAAGKEHMSIVRAISKPTPPAVGSGALTWAPPLLSSPTVRNLTNAARSVPTGSGGDLRVTCGEILTGSVGETHTYNDVEAIAGEFNSTQSPSSSGHIIPRQVTGTWHLEGWRYFSALAGDFCTSRQRAAIIQIQACDVDVTHGGISYHSDCFQTQITQIDELRIDRCTFRSDWQGIVLINELPIPASPDASFVNRTIVRRTIFRRGQLQQNMAFFLAKPPKSGAAALGPIEMYDVWMEDSSIAYPHTDFNQWDGGGSSGRFGAFRINKSHANGQTYPFWRFSVTGDIVPSGPFVGQAAHDCNVIGDGGIWIYPQGGNPPSGLNLGAPANAGLGYTNTLGYL